MFRRDNNFEMNKKIKIKAYRNSNNCFYTKEKVGGII
jgi:hypothetical protein